MDSENDPEKVTKQLFMLVHIQDLEGVKSHVDKWLSFYYLTDPLLGSIVIKKE